MFRKTILSAALVAASAVPAAAGGAFSFTFHASNAQDARFIRTGLALYQARQGVERGAFVRQTGTANAAALRQIARGGSVGVIHQDGSGHAATLDQRGRAQAHGIFQFGTGAEAHVAQTTNGQAGLTFQFGFD